MAVGVSGSTWDNPKAQLRAILQELHEHGDIQLDEAVLAASRSLSVTNHQEEIPERASAAELRRSLMHLQEKHVTLMNAAREEIEALRRSLQQAHEELAAARAESITNSSAVSKVARPMKKGNAVTVSQLMHRWIGLASLRSMFQLWHKEAQLERLQRSQLDRSQELQDWRTQVERLQAKVPSRREGGLVPLALLKSWRETSAQQLMSHFMSLWREQAAESQRHRQAIEVFELKAQLQQQDLSRASSRNAWYWTWRQKVLETSMAYRLGTTCRGQLRVALSSWRAMAVVAATRRQRFLHHRYAQITRVFHAWRLRTLRSLAQDLSRNCIKSERHLSQLHATAAAVREYHQRLVKKSVFQVWLQLCRRPRA